MAGYVKEILFDYMNHSLSLEQQVDIDLAIQQLYTQYTSQQVQQFLWYIAGYTIEEIQQHFSVSSEELITTLTHICMSMEYLTEYTDARFIQTIDPKLRKPWLQQFLFTHGTTF